MRKYTQFLEQVGRMFNPETYDSREYQSIAVSGKLSTCLRADSAQYTLQRDSSDHSLRLFLDSADLRRVRALGGMLNLALTTRYDWRNHYSRHRQVRKRGPTQSRGIRIR